MNQPPTHNPYESPESAGRELAAAEIAPARNLQRRLKLPACILIALAIVHLLILFFGLINAVMFVVERAEPLNPQLIIEVYGLGNLATFLASGLAALFIIYGAWKMIWLQSLQVCRAVAIVACIPCLTPLLCAGFPLGAWLLATLLHREAAAEFQRLAQARSAGASN